MREIVLYEYCVRSSGVEIEVRLFAGGEVDGIVLRGCRRGLSERSGSVSVVGYRDESFGFVKDYWCGKFLGR